MSLRRTPFLNWANFSLTPAELQPFTLCHVPSLRPVKTAWKVCGLLVSHVYVLSAWKEELSSGHGTSSLNAVIFLTTNLSAA